MDKISKCQSCSSHQLTSLGNVCLYPNFTKQGYCGGKMVAVKYIKQ